MQCCYMGVEKSQTREGYNVGPALSDGGERIVSDWGWSNRSEGGSFGLMNFDQWKVSWEGRVYKSLIRRQRQKHAFR